LILKYKGDFTMPTSPNQRMKLLHLMKILLERTDDNHTLAIPDLISALAEYDIKAERKSLYYTLDIS